MNFYVRQTDALGDFLNCVPVLAGLHNKFGKFNLIVKHQTAKFKGFKEFLMYQDLFHNVYFDNEFQGEVIYMDNWGSEGEYKRNPNRPIETCKYENFLKDIHKLDFEVDDKFILKYPKCDVEIKDTYYVGDRWDHFSTDNRRKTNILSHLKDFEFIDFNNDLLTNCYIIKESKKPFITNFTGVGMMADLLDKELFCVWKPEDWNPEWIVGDGITWDNGKNINQVFEKHFYLDRKAKLVHASELEKYL
jgi:hypothetical protein